MEHDVDQMKAERIQTVDPEVDAKGQNGQWTIGLVAVDLVTRDERKEISS